MNWFKKFFSSLGQLPELPKHQHDWDKWKEYGFSYQQRICKTCGWRERADIK